MEKQRKLNEEVIACIIASFLDLLEKKDFGKISIVEIITHAGVSRNSFYRNFSSKEDILVRHIATITDEFLLQNTIHVLEVSWEFYIQTILRHMKENKALVEILLRNGKGHLIKDIFDKAIHERSKGKLDEFHIWFLSGGLFNLHQHWAEGDYRENEEEIAKLFSQTVLYI